MAEVRNSFLGLAWRFGEPIIMAVIFVAIKGSGVLEFENGEISYATYVFVGLICFQSFSRAMISPLSLLEENKQLIKQVKIEPESLILSCFYRLLFDALFGALCLLVLIAYQGAFSLANFVMFLPVYYFCTLFGFCIGLFCSPFNVIYKDVGELISLISRPLMFVSPTFMLVTDPTLLALNKLNPLAEIMGNCRSLLMGAGFSNGGALFFWCCFYGSSMLLSVVVFRVSIPLISDKLK